MKLSYTGSGNILYKATEYRCDLYINEDEGGILLKIYVDKGMASFIELPFEIECLQGKLDNGYNFTVYKCSRTNMESNPFEGRSIFIFRAHSLLEGIGINNPAGTKLYKVQFGLSDILVWGDCSGYKIGENHELSFGDPIEIVLYSNEQITIRYFVETSFLPVVKQDLLKDKITLSQQGFIEIESNNAETIDFFEAYYHKLKKLIEISMLRRVRLTKVIGWSHDYYYDIEEKHIEMPITIMTSEINPLEQDSNDQTPFWEWFTLPELLKNNSFVLYFEKYDKLEPIIELFMEAFNPQGISTQRLFLNLVQGLETYHSRFITNALNEFKKRISDVILKNRPKQFIAGDTAFLLANSHSFITLESRLADLLLANFEMEFDTGDIKKYDFPEVVSSTRNYLIHYNEDIRKKKRILTDKEIYIYNSTLLTMMEYYLLRELGFTDIIALREKLKDRWGRVSSTLSIIKASKEKEKLQ